MKKKIAAFFDFDGTIYDGVLAFDFLVYSFLKGSLTLANRLKIPIFFYYYIVDRLNLAERHSSNKEIYGKINGFDAAQMEKDSNGVLKEKTGKFFRKTLERVKWHRNNGHHVVIITSELKQVISPVRKFIYVDDIISTEVAIDNGVYTGQIRSLPIGKYRAAILNSYCSKNNFDMGKSYAYSDHHSDIPMLSSVGHPIAVNPDTRLKAYALRRGWKIICTRRQK